MRLTTVAPQLSHSGIDQIVKLYDASQLKYYTKMAKEDSSKMGYHRVQSEGAFPTAVITDEGANIDYVDFQTPFIRDYQFYKRALGFSVTMEAEETDVYKILARKGQKMALSIHRSEENDVANFMNLATSTADTVTPDGLAIASASHLLQAGTFSNILSGNPVLSVTSLAAAIAAMRVQPDHQGEPFGFMGPYMLWVPPALEDLANRLVQSDRYPTTNDNDPNWPGKQVSAVLSNPYFTSTTAWMLVCMGEENPFNIINRRPLTTKEQPDIDVDGTKYTATKIWTKFAERGQGLVYSSGAGS